MVGKRLSTTFYTLKKMAEETTEIKQEQGLTERPKQNIITFSDLLNPIKQHFEDVKNDKTDPNYVKYKDKYAYPESKYVDDKFQKWFPINSEKVVKQEIFEKYWILLTVEITVYFSPTLSITKIGAGGARIQLPKALTDSIKANPLNAAKITPLDYIDVGNDLKSALTKAKANCQQRFYVCADATDRIIFSPEEKEEIEADLKELWDSIPSERDKINIKQRIQECKTINQKFKLLNQLREIYG